MRVIAPDNQTLNTLNTLRFEWFEQVAQQAAAKQKTYKPDMWWKSDASCKGSSPNLFFPVGSTGMAIDQILAAKAVCSECPSQEPCLEYALLTNQDSGIWGATSEDERRELRRVYIRNRPNDVVAS